MCLSVGSSLIRVLDGSDGPTERVNLMNARRVLRLTTSGGEHGLPLIYALSLVPVIDAIINQVPALQQMRVGPTTLFQLFRGAVLTVILATVLFHIHRLPKRNGFTTASYLFCVACLVVFAVKEVSSTHVFPLQSIVGYLKVVYWLSAWLLVVAISDTPKKCRILLTGIAIGSVIAAAVVILGYLVGFGGVPTYAAKGVVSSRGGFSSGKGTQGLLLCGALVSLGLGTGRGRRLCVLAAAGCISAAFLVYARVGMVSGAAALLWLAAWHVRMRIRWRRPAVVSVGGLIVVLALLSVIYLEAVGTEQLRIRWSDFVDPEQPVASGRFLIWRAALRGFVSRGVPSQLLGVGFTGMLDTSERHLGLAVHTHSDLFDMLSVGGLLGLVLFAVVVRGLAGTVWRAPRLSGTFAVGVGVFLVYFIQAVLTGQMFFPSTMYAYVVAITCLVGMGAPTAEAVF